MNTTQRKSKKVYFWLMQEKIKKALIALAQCNQSCAPQPQITNSLNTEKEYYIIYFDCGLKIQQEVGGTKIVPET